LETALLTQSSIKVILGYSSAAHMGFMLFLCGIGAYSAATLHLVAHSFYKAHAFLSSGSAVDVARAYRVALPKRFFKISRLILSLLLALLVYAVLLFLFSVGHYFEPVYVLMGLILLMGLTQLIAPALDSSGSVFAIGITAGLATLVAMSFLTLEKLAHYLLYASFPTHGHITPVALTIFICILVLFALVIVIQILKPLPGKTLFRRRLYVAFKNGFYANALFNRIIDANAQKNGGVG
jgi:NAD(P)H-quinone oxidoreductase subunit 5